MAQLSIITITKNNLAGLRLTHASLFFQDSIDFEWIVIDGASSDGSLCFLSEVKKTFPRVKILSRPDSGIYQAMNRGLEQSSSQYLLFLNAGDALVDHLVVADFHSRCFNAGIIYGNCIFTDGSIQKQIKFPVKIDLKFLLINFICHQATFIQREVILQIGNYDESFALAGDPDFFIRAMLSSDIEFHHWPRFVCLFNTNGISRRKKNALKIFSERWRTVRMHLLSTHNTLDAIRSLLYRLYRYRMGRYYLHWPYQLALKFLFDDFFQVDKSFEFRANTHHTSPPHTLNQRPE